ncbi:MAG: dTMP kinase [Euryarchaeota archaeon]|nr:dTMP kinase [Euryarchaeota archaeon]
MARTRGRLVTFEGIDGSGKTTIARSVAKELRLRGREVLVTREPTGSWLGDVVKSSLRNKPGRLAVDPLAQAHLFMADHAGHLSGIEKVLDSPKTSAIVLSDRFSDSMIAYQGATLASRLGGTGKAMRWLENVQAAYDRAPDVTFLIDVPVPVAMARLESRRTLTDFERPAFLAKVRANYLRLAKRESRYVTINGNKPAGEVAADCMAALRRRRIV